MKKVLLALVLGLTALSSFATQYISQCAMSYGDTADAAKQKLIDAGFTPIGGDLNETVSGNRVWMGAKYTEDLNWAITGFAVYNSSLSGAESRPDRFVRSGITYYKIGSGTVDWCPNVADGAVDLNSGLNGYEMNIYATRDPNAGPPVTDWCQVCQAKSDDARNELASDGFTPVCDQNGNLADCNESSVSSILYNLSFGFRGVYVGCKFSRSADAYRYPEYRTAGTPTSGIKEWKTGNAVAAPIRSNETTWKAGWHIVDRNLTISSRITCEGAVHLILADGCTLTAAQGVTVSGDNSLTIYGQTVGTGTLVANGSKHAAGIGGLSSQAGQNITINGGTVTATGGWGGAGIGGGRYGTGQNITINGGTVTAKGGDCDYWSDGGEHLFGHCNGIGGGYWSAGSNIKVDPSALSVKADGTVLANDGGDLAVKLGGRVCVQVNAGGAITVESVVSDAVSVSPGAWLGEVVTIAVTPGYGGILELPVIHRTGDPSATVEVTAVEVGRRYAFTMPGHAVTIRQPLLSRPADYLCPVYRDGVPANGIERWETITAEYYEDVTSGSTIWGATNHTTWYVVAEDVTVASRITCNGDVRLILKDGCMLTAARGITVTGDCNALTIYGQTDGTGKLVANGSDFEACIGGGEKQVGENITINGGTVTVQGGRFAAGIGGGYARMGQNIRINGGAVTATTQGGGAGIGGAWGSDWVERELPHGMAVRYCNRATNVYVNPKMLYVKADKTNPPATLIANDGGDLSAKLKDKCSVVIAPSTVSVGDGVTATFADGVCTVSGEGAMSEHAPLMGDDSTDGMLELCRNDIRSLVIGNGVTSVAPERFNAFPALANVTIAASVARIGAGAFANCSALESITFLGDTLPTIEEGALDVRVSIELVDGIPVVSSTPYVTVGERSPRLMGAKSLVNPIRWEQVEAGKESEYKFFKVEIK